MIELTNNHFAVELTTLGDEFKSFRILDPDKKWTVPYLKYSYRSIYHTNNRGKDFYCSEEDPLSPGNWQIVCTSKEATEEQAAGIVQVISTGKLTGRPQYRRYDRDPVKDTPARSWTRDSRHAIETLLASKGCDSNKNYLILKKI